MVWYWMHIVVVLHFTQNMYYKKYALEFRILFANLCL
jgi:hypothetical protein